MTAPARTTTPKIRHEEFCLPRPGSGEPRIESYDYLDDSSGRSKPTHRVTRCLECGAADYKQIGA